jgi:hypothetical protein
MLAALESMAQAQTSNSGAIRMNDDMRTLNVAAEEANGGLVDDDDKLPPCPQSL